jgi:MFS family permease
LIYVGLKHEAIRKTETVNIDYLGIFTLIPGIVLLLLGLTFGGDKFEWLSLESILIFGSTIVFIVLFIIFERRAVEPILDLSLFKNRVFSTTNILGFLLGLGMFGAIMFVPLFMQGVLGVSPTKAGSTMTPMMIGMILSSIIGGRLLLKFRFRTVLTFGMSFATLGFFLMSMMDGSTTIFTAYSFMAILGIGMGLVMPTLMIAVQNEFPKSQLGSVTAASTFFRSIGGTMGITILNAVMNHNLQQNMDDAVVGQKDPILHEALKALADKTDTLFNIMLYPENLKMPAEVSNVLVKTIENAWIDAFSSVFITGIFFVSAGILVALSVGSGRIKRDQETEKELG